MHGVFRNIALPWAATLVAFVMLIIVNLSGSTSKLSFLQQLYFSSVKSGLSKLFWTMYNFCNKADSGSITCTPNFAAYPYAPYELNSAIQNQNVYYYGLRAAYGVFVASVALAFVAIVIGLVLIFWRLRRAYSVFTVLIWLAYFTAAAGAALITALHTSGRNAFNSLGYSSSLGVPMMAFMWTGAALLLVACFFLCCIPEPVFVENYKNNGYESEPPLQQSYYVPPMEPSSYQQYPFQQGYAPQNGYQPAPVQGQGQGYRQY